MVRLIVKLCSLDDLFFVCSTVRFKLRLTQFYWRQGLRASLKGLVFLLGKTNSSHCATFCRHFHVKIWVVVLTLLYRQLFMDITNNRYIYEIQNSNLTKKLCLGIEFYSMQHISMCPGSAYINCSCEYVGFDFMKSILWQNGVFDCRTAFALYSEI